MVTFLSKLGEIINTNLKYPEHNKHDEIHLKANPDQFSQHLWIKSAKQMGRGTCYVQNQNECG